jgi:hypothetical protein
MQTEAGMGRLSGHILETTTIPLNTYPKKTMNSFFILGTIVSCLHIPLCPYLLLFRF